MELYGSLYNISGSVTASAFTGSFVGDGSGLVGIQASGVTGLNLSQIASGDATASISTTGFTVNKNTQIQGNLSVSGALIANEYIVSSSVTYMTTSFASGSSAFGDDLMDTHKFTGSVQITGSISLNGQAIGTGKLDETTFQSYTSSNDSKVTTLETSSGSLNSFTSSINTTIKSKLDSENVISGSVQVNITGTTGYSAFSSSVSSSIGSLSSSVATTDLNQENRLTALETSSGSLNTFTSSINTTIKSKLDSESVISGSAQVNITSTTGYSTFSSSISNSINDLSGAIATTTSGLASVTTMLSSSLTSSIGDLSSSVATTTVNLKNRIDTIETSTGSLNSFTSSINTTIKSKLDTENVISGSIQVNITGITGYSSFSSSVSESIGNLSSSVATTTSGISSNLTSLSSSVATTTSGLTSTITSLSSSVATTTSGVNTTVTNLSSSIATTTLNQSGRLDSIESKTGSYATTGSNIFKSSQTISGSMIITENLTVLGSSSITYVTSSQLRVDDNIITVNTASPGSRFGGLEVHDSGSVGIATGSLLWDSVNNRWVYQNSSEASYGGGVLLSGPRSSGSLGSELTLTSGRIAKSAGGDHLNDSNITDDGTTVTVLSNTVINGTIISTGTTIVSGSSQIAHDSTTGYAANKHIDHTSVSISAGNGLSGGGDISATRTLTLDTTSATFTSGVKTKLNTEGVVSGSAQVSFGSITGVPSGLVSGSSQITFGSISGIPSGLVSGSSQITLSSTSGFSTYINQAVLTTSTPTFSTVSATTFTGALSGNATTSTSTPTLTGSGALTTQSGSGTLIHTYALTAGQTGLFSTSDNSNSIITFNRHPGDYYSQLGFNSTGTIFYRSFNATAINTSQSWKTIIDSSNIGSQSVTYATTAGALTSMNISQFTNNSGYVTTSGLSTDTDSEQTIGGKEYKFNNGAARMNIDPRWNESGYDADLGTLHIWAWTAGGTPYGRAGLALYNGSAYQYITTKSSTTGVFINNTQIVTNSGNWGINITGNAATAGGFTPSQTSGTANRIVVADANGYIINNYFNASGGGSERNASGMGYFAGHNSSDYYYRSYTAAAAAALLSGQSMNISGTATNITQYTINQNVGTGNAPTFAGGTINGSLYVNANNDVTTLAGSITLYSSGNATTSMIMFKNTTGLGYGNHGGIAGSYNTYFVMDTTDRGWIFRNATTSGNVASVSNTGVIAANSDVRTGGLYLRTAAGKGWLSGGYGTYEDSTTTGAIYSIGGSYYPTSTSFNNMHGVGYTHTNSNLLPTGPGTNGWGFYVLTNGTPNVWLGAEGPSWFAYNVNPKTNGGASLGNSSYRWANVYTQDLHLSNDGKEGGNEIDGTTGDWTLQEGQENLYIINNKNGKKFKINLTEII